MKGKTLLAFSAGVASAWLYWENTHLQLTRYAITDPNLPDGLRGLRIAQISDFHNTACKKVQTQMIEALRQQQPDCIFITGDFIDSRHTDETCAMACMAQLTKIAPVYYVAGNHECRKKEKLLLWEAEWKRMGVTVLHDAVATLQRGEAQCTLCGLYDPSYALGERRKREENEAWVKEKLQTLLPVDGYRILLCHRPELFLAYCESRVDLVFCGHAHGGQGRFPWGGGWIAPQQGFFPKYTEGCYSQNGTTMVVSRGIGNSLVPLRVNNRPELLIVTLQ